jgi:hypothetical protein
MKAMFARFRLLSTTTIWFTACWLSAGTSLGRVLDDFDDNTKTGWQDFTFVPGLGLPVEQNGQFEFILPPAGQAIFTGSRKISEEFELKAGRTIEFKVDLVEGVDKDSFAVLAFIPTANSLGTLAGYGLAKSTTDLLLTKGIGKYFYNEDVSPPVKNINVTLLLRLSATADAVTITGQVLDKDDGNAVIWERTVVDTPAADVLADGTDSPAAPYLTKGHFTLYCYEDFDPNAPQAEYKVVYDNAEVCVLDESVLDDFDDNVKTQWSDFTFVPGLGLPVEQNGQFEFNLPPAGQAIFTGSRKTSRVFDLRECGRLRLSVDLVHGEDKDSFAVLAFIPEANSLGTLAGYGLAKSTTDILLTKGIGKYFYNEDVSPPVKNDNVTLVLDLTVSNANTVHITGRVLDKDDNNAVLWERTVVDTPDADVLADGTDSPAAAYLTTGHFALYCYEDYSASSPQAVYQVLYDNATVLAPALTANTPPIISDVQPNETANFLPADTTEITFKVQDDKPLVDSQITVTLNGTVYNTGNGLSVTGTGTSRDVALGGLVSQTDYTAVLRVVDSDNATNSVTLHFDTFLPDNLVIEIEDYNFNGGSFIDNPVPGPEGGPGAPDSYTTVAGISEVDYHETRATPNGTNTRYRPSDPVRMQHTFDLQRQKFLDAGGGDLGVFDFDVGDIVGGEWLNYTRTFPAGSYHVYLRQSLVNMPTAESALELVTGDRTQPDQTTRSLGTFLGRLSGFQYRNVPLTDATGQKTILRLSGEQTLRLRQVTTTPGDGLNSQGYLVLVPTADPGIQRATVTSVSPAAGSTVQTVRLSLSATIQDRDTSVLPETIALELNGNTVMGTVTPIAEGATITYDVSPLPPSGALNTAKVRFTDNLNVSQTNEWTFTVVYKALNPANRGAGPGVDRGFSVRMAQGDPGAVPHENSLMQAEDILAGRYPLVMDTNTTSQVVNQTKRPGDVRGLFPDDELVPGLYDENLNFISVSESDFAVEIVAWLDLAPGVYRFGGRTDDGFKCSSGNSLHDLSSGAILGFWNGGPADRPERSEFEFVVTQGGLYPFRFMWYERTGTGYAEFYSVNLATDERTLINDPNAAEPITAYLSIAGVALQSATVVSGPYEDDATAVLDAGAKQFTVPRTGATQFYRIRAAAPSRITQIRIAGPNVVITYE